MAGKDPAEHTEHAHRGVLERVRRALSARWVFLEGHGPIGPGEYTTAITPEEARRRPDFEVVTEPAPTPTPTPAPASVPAADAPPVAAQAPAQPVDKEP